MRKLSGDISTGTRKMGESPATRGPPSPTRRLNRSKSVFSLAQDFFKMALNTPSNEPTSGSQDSYAKPGSWNVYGSLRETWGGPGPRVSSQGPAGHSTLQSLKPSDSHYEGDASSSLLRHRKSLHNLFGTVGKRSSIKRDRTDQTVQPNVLRKRSGAGDNLQGPENSSVQSIEDADRVRPPQIYAAGSHATIGRKRVTFKDETIEPVPRPDSGVGVDAICAPCSGYQGSTCGRRAPNNKQEEAIFQPPKAPIEPTCLSKTNSSNTDASGYAVPLSPTYSDRRLAARPMVSLSESCIAGPYPGTTSQSLRRIKENLDYNAPDYNKLLTSSGMPTEIDIDPFFMSRARSLEQRYKDLSIEPQLRQTSNTENDPQIVLESIDQNATRMSKNLKISEDRCGQRRFSCHSNETAPPGSLPQDSWINVGFLGHECGMFTHNDKVAETNAFLDEKNALGTIPKKGETTPLKKNVIFDERPNTSPENSLCETLSASPLLVSKRKKTLLPRKKRLPMRSTTRNSSIRPFHIDFPKTEFDEAHHETYQSKSDAIGSLFQNVVECSNYILFDRGSNTFYPQPKEYVFSPLEEQSNQPKLECVWLPIQFGRFKGMDLSQEPSLDRCAGNRRGDGDQNHQLPGVGECEGGARATSPTQSKAPRSTTRISSNSSILDLYLATSEGEHQRTEASKLKQRDATQATALPIRSRTPFGEPASPPKLGNHWDEDDGIITEPLDADRSTWRTKTWADLGIEFLDKYAPDKKADGQKRAVDAARNFLRAHGKLTSDYDSVSRPQIKTWSRDRDGSEDISFLHIEDLARYETLRAEYRRHMAMNMGSSSASGRTDALTEINHVPGTHKVSRTSSRDSGYAEIELIESHLDSRGKSTSEAAEATLQGSFSNSVEEIATLKVESKISVSPYHSPIPFEGEEQAQLSVLQSTGTMGSSTPPSFERTSSFGKFELEYPSNIHVEKWNITETIDTKSLKTPRRAPLQVEKFNSIRETRVIQNQPPGQAEAAYYGPTDEPSEKRKRGEEDDKENEERNWRDIMLYG
ncbi:hypothetical protein V493_08414 [Pseudogymnoascus sp. VKM F-4281 (FW-2241)]|nr:hypothetical protein V493_08414 [Pseudogymnoascus sp. VKM F-4281 (FW-2241)]